MGDRYVDHCQQLHVHHGSVFICHISDIFSLLCHPTLAATWLMSLLVISAAKLKILYFYILLQAFLTVI
jgi:hypothetical protein